MLNREIVIKKTIKEMLISALINTLVWCLFIYYIMIQYMDGIQDVLNSIIELGNNGILTFVLIIAPIILVLYILSILFTLSRFGSNSKKRRK